MPKRIDAADTVDNATHLLHRLQVDGWAVETAGVRFDYGETSKSGPKVPVMATITIELIPTRGA